jgi:hypothetical protein
MSERSPDRPQSVPRADPTRDIRLPPLRDRPASAVPEGWSSYVPKPEGTPKAQSQVDGPTDRWASSSDHPLRQGTQAFTPPPSVQLLKVSVTPTRRRTATRVLWTLVLLTLAVIIACGVYLVIVVTQR